jgi:hypothetical protein
VEEAFFLMLGLTRQNVFKTPQTRKTDFVFQSIFFRWWAQLLERAEKEAEAAESSYADAAAFAKELGMEEGRALLRCW